MFRELGSDHFDGFFGAFGYSYPSANRSVSFVVCFRPEADRAAVVAPTAGRASPPRGKLEASRRADGPS